MLATYACPKTTVSGPPTISTTTGDYFGEEERVDAER